VRERDTGSRRADLFDVRVQGQAPLARSSRVSRHARNRERARALPAGPRRVGAHRWQCPHCGRPPDEFGNEETVVEDGPRETMLKLFR